MTGGKKPDDCDLPDHNTFINLLSGCKQLCAGSLDTTTLTSVS